MIIILLNFLILKSDASISAQIVSESAKKNHPVVKIALDKWHASEEKIKSSQGSFDTKLVTDHYRVATGMWARTFTDVVVEKPLPVANSKIYLGYSYGFNGVFPPQFSTMSTNSGGTPRLGFSTSLWRHRALDENRANLINAKYDANIYKGEKYLTDWDIKKMSESAYWEWVTSNRVEVVYKNLLAIGEQRNDNLHSRVKRGDAPILLVKENEQYIASRKVALASAIQRKINAQNILSLFYRDQDGQPIKIEETTAFEDFPTDFSFIDQKLNINLSFDEIINARPDLKNFHLTKLKAETDLALSEHELKPKVDLWGDYTRNIGDEDVANPPHIYSFGVKLEIPIERNLGRGKIAEASRLKMIAQKELQIALENYKNDFLINQYNLKLQKEKVEQAKIEFEKAQELLEAETIKFKTGGSNLFLVNLREEAVAHADVSWSEARLELMMTFLHFEAISKNILDEKEI
jgi:outer membrane protein TolC